MKPLQQYFHMVLFVLQQLTKWNLECHLGSERVMLHTWWLQRMATARFARLYDNTLAFTLSSGSVSLPSWSCSVMEALYVRKTLAVKPSIKSDRYLFNEVVWMKCKNTRVNEVSWWKVRLYKAYLWCKHRAYPSPRYYKIMDVLTDNLSNKSSPSCFPFLNNLRFLNTCKKYHHFCYLCSFIIIVLYCN